MSNPIIKIVGKLPSQVSNGDYIVSDFTGNGLVQNHVYAVINKDEGEVVRVSSEDDAPKDNKQYVRKNGGWVSLDPNDYFPMEEPVVGQNYLTFSSEEPFSISFNQKSWDGTLEYSTDTQNWTEWDASEISSAGNVLYLRGSGNSKITGVNSQSYAMQIIATVGVECSGNIMTLLDYEDADNAVMGNTAFASMFYGCTSLTSAPELPATTLAEECYFGMFVGCTNLTSAPELPATTLVPYCYRGMFSHCTSLVTAPELPAIVLAVGCYEHMFYECTSLATAPELPATTLATWCYTSMFYGCTSLTSAPELPATTLLRNCYSKMFSECTSIKISSTKTGIYQKPWRVPTVGTGTSAYDWNASMLKGTGGTFTDDPSINTTYYQAA